MRPRRNGSSKRPTVSKKHFSAAPVAVKLLVGADSDSVGSIEVSIKEEMKEEIFLGRGLMAKCFES